jgi:hypothetical protein
MPQQQPACDFLPHPAALSGLLLQHRYFGIKVRDLAKQSSTRPDRKSVKKVLKPIFLDFPDCEEHNFAYIARGRAFFYRSDLFIRLSTICLNPILSTERQ